MSNETRNTASITSKVWSFCNPLRDVGVGYGDYLEQLTRNICQFVVKATVAFFATVKNEDMQAVNRDLYLFAELSKKIRIISTIRRFMPVNMA
jgi:hypothetical protein